MSLRRAGSLARDCALILCVALGAKYVAAASSGDAKPSLAPVNLALHKVATASDSQGGQKPPFAVDGDDDTRWCANGGGAGRWWQVDLGQSEELTGCEITWEFDNKRYQYRVEGSPDGKQWSMLSDQTQTTADDQVQNLKFSAKGVRYVRISVTGLSSGAWASIYEVAVYGTKLGPAPKPVAKAASPAPATNKPDLLKGIQVPGEFNLTLFAASPDVSYPTCLAAAPTGEVYVGIDENGSLDRKPERGRVLRCTDTDHDGRADKFTVFARMDSPRGVFFDHQTLYVLHPPRITAFQDDNGDGVSDRSDVLVDGLGFDLNFRGADHTTNGMQLGIDGYLYVAVGDYGFTKASGKDGRTLQLHGGGVVRIRLDGSGLEIVSRGQRNIYDVAIDPFMNLFTRDNTNDGGGWNVRLSHVIRDGHYGYPSLFTNFGDEIVPPLADYGGGSPCGSLFADEPQLPAPFGRALYTCDWGRSIVYRHPLKADGAGFDAEQVAFVSVPRPTDMDIDGQGRMYIASWRDGGFTYSGPNIGYVVCVAPKELAPKGAAAELFPQLSRASDAEMLKYMASPSHVRRLHTQLEMLRRGDKPLFAQGLETIARSPVDLAIRSAAVHTLAQLRGAKSHATLIALAELEDLREVALRALSDRAAQGDTVDSRPFVKSLKDANARVRLQAATALGHLKQSSVAPDLLPLLADSDPLVAHVAVHSLGELKAANECLAVLDDSASSPQRVAGTVRVLHALHEPAVVDGLVKRLAATGDSQRKQLLLTALCRLYYQEAPWDGRWWGTRPDTTGPYFNRATWEKSPAIAEVLAANLAQADSVSAGQLLKELARHKIELPGTADAVMRAAASDPTFRGTAVRLLESAKEVPDAAIELFAGAATSSKEATPVRIAALRALQRHSQSRSQFTTAMGAFAVLSRQQKLDADFAKTRDEFARDPKHVAHSDLLVQLASGEDAAQREIAFLVLLGLTKSASGAPAEARSAVAKTIDGAWSKPLTAESLLRAIALANAEQYADQVRAALKDPSENVRKAATATAEALRLDRNDSKHPRVLIATLPYDDVLAAALKQPGDAQIGGQLFVKLGCVNCHSVSQGETLKGPFLGGIAARYSRKELIESVTKPSSKIAQGFETQFFVMGDGRVQEGFVVREAGDEVEIRNQTGVASVLKKEDIEERGRREQSIMPTGLVDKIEVSEFSALLAYLESLKAK